MWPFVTGFFHFKGHSVHFPFGGVSFFLGSDLKRKLKFGKPLNFIEWAGTRWGGIGHGYEPWNSLG